MGTFQGIELADVQLVGERLELRRWAAQDAERVQSIMRDPDGRMRRYLALPDPYTLEGARKFVTIVGHEGRDDGTGLGSAVVERATGQLVGAAALRLTGDPEIGYWIAPDAQGHAYASEATRLLTDWGFGLGLPRVRLACDVRNLASVRTAMAAGFEFEGVARDGHAGSAAGDGAELPLADLARFARLPGDPGTPIDPAFPPLPPDGLRDDVLGLRQVVPGDAAAVAESEDEIADGWGFTDTPHTTDEWRQYAARSGLDWLVGRVARMAMVDLQTGAYAGSLQLRKAGPPQVGGVGYTVHPNFRGRNYTTRALRLLVPWAFETAGFVRLELGAKRGNIASQRSAAAAGFEPDGTRRARLRNPDGTFSDEVCFTLVHPRHR